MKQQTLMEVLSSQHNNDRKQCRKILNDIHLRCDKELVKESILTFWKQELKQHVDAEETLLIPFLTRHHFNGEYINVLRREHDTIRLLAQRIPAHDDGVYLYKAFINLVDQHTDFENEVVFKKMKEDIPEQELLELDISLRKLTA